MTEGFVSSMCLWTACRSYLHYGSTPSRPSIRCFLHAVPAWLALFMSRHVRQDETIPDALLCMHAHRNMSFPSSSAPGVGRRVGSFLAFDRRTWIAIAK